MATILLKLIGKTQKEFEYRRVLWSFIIIIFIPQVASNEYPPSKVKLFVAVFFEELKNRVQMYKYSKL